MYIVGTIRIDRVQPPDHLLSYLVSIVRNAHQRCHDAVVEALAPAHPIRHYLLFSAVPLLLPQSCARRLRLAENRSPQIHRALNSPRSRFPQRTQLHIRCKMNLDFQFGDAPLLILSV